MVLMEPRQPQNTQVQYLHLTVSCQNADGCTEGLALTSVLVFAGPKLFKEPSFKSNKFIIHNALSRCCLAGKVNETQKNKIVEVDDWFYTVKTKIYPLSLIFRHDYLESSISVIFFKNVFVFLNWHFSHCKGYFSNHLNLVVLVYLWALNSPACMSGKS